MSRLQTIGALLGLGARWSNFPQSITPQSGGVNALSHNGDAEREGFEPSIPVDPVYGISRASERGAGLGTEGHFVFSTSALRASKGRLGHARWVCAGVRREVIRRPKLALRMPCSLPHRRLTFGPSPSARQTQPAGVITLGWATITSLVSLSAEARRPRAPRAIRVSRTRRTRSEAGSSSGVCIASFTIARAW